MWNVHHSPHLWKDPDAFRPERYNETFTNPAFGGKWAGAPDGILALRWGVGALK